MRGDWILLAVCTFLAAVLARPYAGSWNDASRLATAESLVDRGTLAIDDSIFVAVPRTIDPLPYPANRTDLLGHGTLDKLFIHGSYYSDKTPVPSLYLAGIYKLGRMAGGPTADERVDWFCRVLTWSSSGVAFVLAVAGILAIGRRLNLSPRWRFLLAATFAFGTIAPGYVGSVNGHIVQFAAAVWLFALLLDSTITVRRLSAIGLLLGVAYAADASAGPTLCVCSAIGLFATTRRPMTVALLVAGAAPLAVLHHAVNYSVGGTFAPANANPEYFQFEGSPFRGGAITGRWRHESMNHFVTYVGDLLFGKQGFLFHNPPALLAAIWAIPLLVKSKAERPVLAIGLAWCASTLLLAAVSSTNRSGQCLSVRWFLPLLAPAAVAFGVLLRDRKDLRPDAIAMASWGGVIGVLSAVYGLWIPTMLPGFWLIVAGTVATAIAVRWRMRGERPAKGSMVEAIRGAIRSLPWRSRRVNGG